jgi:hypothetical protein
MAPHAAIPATTIPVTASVHVNALDWIPRNGRARIHNPRIVVIHCCHIRVLDVLQRLSDLCRYRIRTIYAASNVWMHHECLHMEYDIKKARDRLLDRGLLLFHTHALVAAARVVPDAPADSRIVMLVVAFAVPLRRSGTIFDRRKRGSLVTSPLVTGRAAFLAVGKTAQTADHDDRDPAKASFLVLALGLALGLRLRLVLVLVLALVLALALALMLP